MDKPLDLVVGFAFDRGNVLLIQKKRPQWQMGKLNGVGGHIQYGESPEIAMVREFEEETGLSTGIEDWKHRVTLLVQDNNATVYFFAAYNIPIREARQVSDEKLFLVRVGDMCDYRTIPNLQWLIPYCFDRSIEDNLITLTETNKGGGSG